MPRIELDHCINCMKCVKDCPSDAIDIDSGTINHTCIHCGHCVAICPESTIHPEGNDIKKLKPALVSPDKFRDLSANIRTCRSYMDRELDVETLDLLVENMKNYPSASNARPLEITILNKRETVERINDLTANTLIRTIGWLTSPLIMPLLQLLAPKLGLRRLRNYKKQFIAKQSPGSSQVCHHAPAVMLLHAPATKYGMADADAYIWASYTSIYASTLGLGTCFNGFITNAMKRSKSMRKEFGIPAGHQVYAALLLGFPKVKYLNETGRKSPELNYI